MIDDFCASSEYAELIQSWRASELSARELAEAFCERDETYHVYVWLLIAADLGDEDAADAAAALHEVDQVCDEDVYLAELQLTLWWHHGIEVSRDDERALAHLSQAALPFLDLPSASELQAAAASGTIDEVRERAWADALAKFGIPKTANHGDVDAALTKLFRLAGWPATLDISLPLGPALPNRPHYLHFRHQI